jgi:hypothetical protein
MTDVSVYYFIRRSTPDGEELLSKRRAILETIKRHGKALMHSLRKASSCATRRAR